MSKVEKQLVFIDDSGDPGLVNSPSEYILMAAVVFNRPTEAERASSIISAYREVLGWSNNHEFKFRKSPKHIIVECLRRACLCDFMVYGAYIEKKKLDFTPLVDLEKMRDLLICELLKTIPMENAKITIDGKPDKQVRQRKIARFRKVANPHHDKRIIIKYADSIKEDLIQLADLVAGSINRSFKSELTDASRYISIFRSKIAEIKQIEISPILLGAGIQNGRLSG